MVKHWTENAGDVFGWWGVCLWDKEFLPSSQRCCAETCINFFLGVDTAVTNGAV